MRVSNATKELTQKIVNKQKEKNTKNSLQLAINILKGERSCAEVRKKLAKE